MTAGFEQLEAEALHRHAHERDHLSSLHSIVCLVALGEGSSPNIIHEAIRLREHGILLENDIFERSTE